MTGGEEILLSLLSGSGLTSGERDRCSSVVTRGWWRRAAGIALPEFALCRVTWRSFKDLWRGFVSDGIVFGFVPGECLLLWAQQAKCSKMHTFCHQFHIDLRDDVPASAPLLSVVRYISHLMHWALFKLLVTSPIGSHEKRITVCLQFNACLQFNVTSREKPEAYRSVRAKNRPFASRVKHSALYSFLCRISQFFTPENTKKSSKPAFRRANYVQHLVDGTGTERDPRNTPPAYNPRKNGGTFKTPICLGTSTWRQMADGRWTRQMAERVAEKKALFDPALQTLGQEEALLAASSALLLCACAKKTTTRLWTR